MTDIRNRKLNEFENEPQSSHLAFISEDHEFVKVCKDYSSKGIKTNHLQTLEDTSQTSEFSKKKLFNLLQGN